MFSAEIKINGIMIAHIYGHNTSELIDGQCKYKYEVYRPNKAFVKGDVLHKRSDDILQLLKKIIDKS